MVYSLSPTRSLVWGGLAATVLVLNQVGVLDSLLGLDSPAQASGQVEVQDGTFAEAEAMARQHLNAFVAQAEQRPDGWNNMALQVEFADGPDVERIWVEQFTRVQGDLFRGTLVSDGATIDEMAQGRVVTFRQGQVYDWSFQQNGRAYGYFSVRAELPSMTSARADIMRGFLADQPLPRGW
ncbi:DUF2314 domain-containing protein [Pseudoprimorskyibacter insulae]|uniref:DUF2314 domain-containing protein n=1 Tax=Pseudoprimorskyibacter insulae TaxID=1695997 RepID=A0A2R8AYB4_9RHOB|nr:DUF2314 domain-containing protein [Pseudoprimorskyibacter insulae]SPF80854.1 hypothetical protein PRI8871_02667 [Pseudoprimorskyibacter insulae]